MERHNTFVERVAQPLTIFDMRDQPIKGWSHIPVSTLQFMGVAKHKNALKDSLSSISLDSRPLKDLKALI